MRRCLSILLLILLSYQFSWAAAATYCTHEPESAAHVSVAHWGHHTHQHQSAAADLSKGKPGKLPGSVDSDCEICHLSLAHPLFSMALPMPSPLNDALAINDQRSYDSPIPVGPDRPDWRLAL